MAVVGGFIDFWRCVFASGGPTLVWTRWKNGASMSRAAIKLGVLAHGALIASCSSSNTMMSISVSGGESYPGRSFSVSQLLYAAKGKLQSPTFCGSMTTAVSQAELGLLEQDAMEVLSLIRSMKNHFAPINRIPPEIFSLIPEYWDNSDMDEDLITMTHVCRGWRELLIARTWLWARLDCTNVDKTHVYIERAKLSPMKISLFEDQDRPYLERALLWAVPHFRRLKSLTIVGTSDLLQNLSKHLTLPTPLLGELIIDLTCNPAPVLDDMLFNGDLSSLRILSLGGVVTNLPWKNLRSLTTFKLRCAPGNKITVTHLLNFLQNALHLRDITLDHSIPTSSNAPPSQMVLLPSLKRLTIIANPSHPILNHLCIPVGASLVLDFKFSGDKSPLLDLLPKTAKDHVYDVATVNLYFEKRKKFVQLIRPSGGLTIFGHWKDYVEMAPSHLLDSQILQSLGQFHLGTAWRLAITKCGFPVPTEINKYPHYYILDRMRQLRTLTLIQCHNLPFILSLDPGRNPSGSVLCPELEELVLYIKARKLFNIVELMKMAKERASKNAKLSLITIIGLDELIPGKEVFKLREHVTRVEHRFEGEPPRWDAIAN